MGFTVTIKKCEKEILEFIIQKLSEIIVLDNELFERSKTFKNQKSLTSTQRKGTIARKSNRSKVIATSISINRS